MNPALKNIFWSRLSIKCDKVLHNSLFLLWFDRSELTELRHATLLSAKVDDIDCSFYVANSFTARVAPQMVFFMGIFLYKLGFLLNLSNIFTTSPFRVRAFTDSIPYCLNHWRTFVHTNSRLLFFGTTPFSQRSASFCEVEQTRE